MNWHDNQFIHKSEVERIINNERNKYNNTSAVTHTDDEKLYKPGTHIKLICIHKGVLKYVPGVIMEFSGTAEKALVVIGIEHLDGICFTMALPDTRSIVLDMDPINIFNNEVKIKSESGSSHGLV